ncbi:DUF4129 domain-containing protein [Actinocrinis puniceicyclus]|uniref:DUF4129 domain-containing protein n=1 Tax=Actinocrinis puniceicyclus TaxID=977794 RepID=A0A8J7WMG0_9ACTN|nr:DUF4129 domain-containing protein [Actinocrinis puniceicyclus]MBS2962160.1 DUF4129 domain-containing protein [Actinocrinis puniceicyclus]
MPHADTPVTVGSDQARQWAVQELSKPQYHRAPQSPSPPPSPSPSTAVPQPSPPSARPPSPGHALTVILIILAAILLVVVVLLVLRRLGKPRTEKKIKQTKAGAKSAGSGREARTVLTGAALHRHDAELAAAGSDWAAAVRERFRAVIATLDERGLLPERADRTADEAARDAGVFLSAHAEALAAAARAFDEVEYGEYVATPEAYAVISEVDELVRTQQPDTLRLPIAIAPTMPGGMQ